jgi:hypothetical protein
MTKQHAKRSKSWMLAKPCAALWVGLLVTTTGCGSAGAASTCGEVSSCDDGMQCLSFTDGTAQHQYCSLECKQDSDCAAMGSGFVCGHNWYTNPLRCVYRCEPNASGCPNPGSNSCVQDVEQSDRYVCWPDQV